MLLRVVFDAAFFGAISDVDANRGSRRNRPLDIVAGNGAREHAIHIQVNVFSHHCRVTESDDDATMETDVKSSC